MNNNLKEKRLKRGMSVSELARRSGLSRTAIINIENGKSDPMASTMEKISRALEYNVEVIFFNNGVIQELQKRGEKQ